MHKAFDKLLGNILTGQISFWQLDDMTAGQHWPEFLTGEALAVAVAMKELSLEEREGLFAHYVILGDASYKARMMMLPRRTYYTGWSRGTGRSRS